LGRLPLAGFGLSTTGRFQLSTEAGVTELMLDPAPSNEVLYCIASCAVETRHRLSEELVIPEIGSKIPMPNRNVMIR